jgi:hypothetical protein
MLRPTTLSVLMPANPPEPRNARIVRRFDLEAAEYDWESKGLADCARSEEKVVVEQGTQQQQQRSRKARRAARNESLFAAARLR